MNNLHGNDNPQPAIKLPPAVKALVLVNIAVYAMQALLPQIMTEDFTYALAFVPGRYTGAVEPGVAALISPFTHMFLHGGILHLGMNVAGMMAFGTGLEKTLGRRGLLLTYFLSGLAGVALHTLFYPHAEAPLIGASGGVSGLFGGVLIMMQAAGLVQPGLRRLLPLIALWIGISLFFGVFGVPGEESDIAWTAHVGGFIAGLLLYKPLFRMKRKKPDLRAL